MKRREFLAATAGTALAAGFGPALAASHGPVKAGYIYVGPVGDLGWSYQHDVGRKEADAATGSESVFVESVPEGADAERVITQMALDGAQIIFTTSFGYMDATNNVAAKFPDVKFEHATGYKRDHANVATYNARFYEGRAVIGHIAGKVTKTNTIGYIGSFPIPEVIMGINSAYIHAKKVNPDVQFKIVWAFTWFDPQKESDAAKALIDQGCDVIMQHTDSTAPVALAEEKGIFCFGQASDMAKFGPNSCLTSIVDNWGPYYTKRIKAVMDGTWAQADTWDGIGEGGVVIAPISDKVPADVKAEAEAMIAAIGDKSYHPFTGPLKWQDGTELLADGAVIDDGTLAGMLKYVEGIEGDIPA